MSERTYARHHRDQPTPPRSEEALRSDVPKRDVGVVRESNEDRRRAEATPTIEQPTGDAQPPDVAGKHD